MTDILDRLAADNRATTHWEGCESEHILCAAAAEIRRLREHPLDTLWRPMRTAPRDGTVIEILAGNSKRIAFFEEDSGLYGGWHWVWDDGEGSNPLIHWSWRPAHPEWNEEPADE